MFVTDDFKADIQKEVQRSSDRELVNEYNVLSHVLNTKGVGETFSIDLYLETMEVLQDEICRRFCSRVAVECQA